MGGSRLESYKQGGYITLPGIKGDTPPMDFDSVYEGSYPLPRRPGFAFEYWLNDDGKRH
jgi:hypothetical protein